jgi:hypothetical protein
MTDFYGRRMSDEAIALLAPNYRFVPVEPESIAFLGPGETEWNRAQEQGILEVLLEEEQSSWIDQVLLEIKTERTPINTPDVVEVEADVQLSLLIGANLFEKGRSTITFRLECDSGGNFRLAEEREAQAVDDDGKPFTELTVGEHKAAVLLGP